MKDVDFSDGLNQLENLIDDVINVETTTASQISTGVVEATTTGALPTTADNIGDAMQGLEDLANSQTTTGASATTGAPATTGAQATTGVPATSDVAVTSDTVTVHQPTTGNEVINEVTTDGTPVITTAPLPKSTVAPHSTAVNQPTTAPLINNPTTNNIIVTTSDDVTTDVATTASTSKSVTISGSLTTAYDWDDDLNDSSSALFKSYAATLESELATIIKSSEYVYRSRVKYHYRFYLRLWKPTTGGVLII